MSDLKPCPFCGGEARVQHQSRELYGDVVDWYGVYCMKQFCGFVSGQSTEAEAIEAWNTRAERTCRVVCIIDGLIMDEPNSIELSCGHTFETWDEVPPNYCPNCGAHVTPKNSETTPKVVSE